MGCTKRKFEVLIRPSCACDSITLYRDITLSENSHHSSFRPFRVTTGSEALAVLLFCPCFRMARFGSFYCS